MPEGVNVGTWQSVIAVLATDEPNGRNGSQERMPLSQTERCVRRRVLAAASTAENSGAGMSNSSRDNSGGTAVAAVSPITNKESQCVKSDLVCV